MMASQAPKHDFAPSWLKIPDQDKPGGSKSSEDNARGPRGRDDYYRQHAEFYGNGPLPRQRSFENCYDDRRGYSPHGGKFRHHSVEDEYYNANCNGYGYHNGYYPGEKCGAPYRSQPALYRDKHPHYPVNGAYPPGYYEGYMYDYYPGGDFHYGQRNRAQRPRENGHHRSSAGEEPSKDLQEEEFPSLNGDSTESKKAPSNGVWDGRPKIAAPAKNSNSVYKVLVSNKGGAGGSNTKKGIKATEGNVTKLNAPSEPFRKPEMAKEGSPTPPMEILNTVTQPKTIGDKKSNFLKALRRNNEDLRKMQEKDDSQSNGHSVEEVNNGVQDLDLEGEDEDDSQKFLSSSLEAEQRLLREMGWTEEEEECVLTEDEKREMEMLSEKLKLRRKEQCVNGHEGAKRTLKAWSPQHTASFSLPDQESDDSDSDLDL